MQKQFEGEAALASLSQNAQSLESQVAPAVIEFEGEALKFEGSISVKFISGKII